jgi:hypothetical protein
MRTDLCSQFYKLNTTVLSGAWSIRLPDELTPLFVGGTLYDLYGTLYRVIILFIVYPLLSVHLFKYRSHWVALSNARWTSGERLHAVLVMKTAQWGNSAEFFKSGPVLCVNYSLRCLLQLRSCCWVVASVALLSEVEGNSFDLL